MQSMIRIIILIEMIKDEGAQLPLPSAKAVKGVV